MNIKIENSDTTNTLEVDWVAVTKHADSIPNFFSDSGEEENESSPLLHLDFNENNGQTLFNKGYARPDLNGTLGSSSLSGSDDPARVDECIIDFCLEFDGSNDRTAIPYDEKLDLAGKDFTISAWINIDSFSAEFVEPIFSNRGTGVDDNGALFMIRGQSDVVNRYKIGFDTNETGGNRIAYAQTELQLNTWHHVAVVFTYNGSNNNEVSFYLDGDLDGTATGLSDIAATTAFNPNYIGWETNYQFDGTIDELKIHNKVLDSNEIKEEYNTGTNLLGGNGNELDLDTGLVGHWKFDERSGTTAADSTLNANDGSLENMEDEDWQLGKLGNALNFDGTNEYVDLADDTFDFDVSDSFSISGWFNLNNDPGWIFNKRVTAANSYYGLELRSDGTVWFVLNNGSTTYRAEGVTDVRNEWVHITAVRNGATNRIELYINGVLDRDVSGPSSGTLLNNSNLELGRYNTEYISGTVDDFRIYNRALSNEEIADIYIKAQIQNVPSKGLIAYYPFNEKEVDGTPGEIRDFGPDPNNAFAYNGTQPDVGVAGGSMLFDGDNDSVEIEFGESKKYDLRLNDFSASVWVKNLAADSDTQGRRILFLNRGSFPNNDAIIMTAEKGNDQIQVVYRDGTNDIDLDYFGHQWDSEWTHIGMVHKGDVLYLYVNGEQVSSLSTGTNHDIFITDGGEARFGALFPNDANLANRRPWHGNIDEVYMYNRALEPYEMNALYRRVAPSERYDGFPELIGGLEEDRPNLHFDFNSKSGTSVNNLGNDSVLAAMDSSMDDNDWVKGVYGNGLEFDGIDDYIDLSNSFRVMNNPSNFTFSTWFKRITDINDPTNHTIDNVLIAKSDDVAIDNFEFGTDGTNIEYYMDTPGLDGSSTFNAGIQNNIWYHVALTYDATTGVKIYLDGELVHENTSYNGALTDANGANSSFGIARPTSQEWGAFNGVLDEVKYLNRTLNQRDVAKEYNNGAPVGYWKMDRGEGNTAYDYSGNDSHGTLTNMDPVTDWVDGQLNNALHFDGINDKVLLSNESFFDFENTDSFSICSWIYHDDLSSTSNTIISKLDGSLRGWEFTAYDGSISGGDANGLTLYIISSWPLNAIVVNYDTIFEINRWYHVCLSYDGSSSSSGVNVYLDGTKLIPDSVISTLSGTILNNKQIEIGSRNNTLNHSGRIDELKIWNYELNEEDILIEFNKGSALRFE